MWWQSRLPSTYSVMDMGFADYGGGPRVGDHRHGAAQRAVTDLRADPTREPDVRIELVARKQRVHLASGREVDGYTINGSSPGPQINVAEGQLVEVHLANESVPSGITLHWHGVDVPNAEDGVAGVTQDAVGVGKEYVYRFVAEHPGTYWYHSHQISHEQVRGGLLGAFVIRPRGAPAPGVLEVIGLSHVYGSQQTVNGYDGDQRVAATRGQQVRVRLINTDNGPMAVWTSGGPYRVLAVDGYDLNQPTPVSGRSLLIPAGGRADLGVTAPADGSVLRVDLGGGPALLIGGLGVSPHTPQPATHLDLLRYGSPAPLGFNPEAANRRFRYDIGRRPGFVNGRPGIWWSINGHLFPDVPMFVVAEGDIVQMRISNHSGALHPMHLHGHHAVVLARNGVKSSGSPWWVDSLDVQSGESYDVAFVADNPGIWMDHCHNLPHAQQGLVAHLMYEGVTEPFRVGGDTANEPE
jgi:FtsP/CotA-like multicopper oxidase with cupredoxin domain